MTEPHTHTSPSGAAWRHPQAKIDGHSALLGVLHAGGDIKAAADALGVSRNRMYHHLGTDAATLPPVRVRVSLGSSASDAERDAVRDYLAQCLARVGLAAEVE